LATLVNMITVDTNYYTRWTSSPGVFAFARHLDLQGRTWGT